jgi:hypothetical protein
MATVVNLNAEGASNGLYAIDTKRVPVIDDQRSARVILEGVIRWSTRTRARCKRSSGHGSMCPIWC